jgi:heme oxygenase (mycobilin-producing)
VRDSENIEESARASGPTSPQFVAISRFTVANDMTECVKTAFRARPHLVDTAPGFVRMEVMSPVDAPDEIWLVTYWTDRESFATWHRSHEFKESHRGIPKGLKLVPKSAALRYFEIFST